MPHHHNNRGGTVQGNPLEEFLNLLKEKECFHQLDLREIVAPRKYAERIAENLSGQVNMTQLRKFFNEVKRVCTLGKKGKTEIAKTKLWRLYYKIPYATARNLLPKEFAEVLTEVMQKVEKCNTPKDYEQLDDFFSALIAYAKYYESLKDRNRRFKK